MFFKETNRKGRIATRRKIKDFAVLGALCGLKFSFSLLALLYFTGCKSVKVDTAHPDSNGKMIISMERTACYGKCPIYQVRIYDNGLLYYEGVKFTEKIGMYCAVLSKKRLSQIVSEFDKANLFAMSAQYPDYNRPPVDLSACIITYQKRDEKKKITDYGIYTPKELKKVELSVDNIVKNLNLQYCDK